MNKLINSKNGGYSLADYKTSHLNVNCPLCLFSIIYYSKQFSYIVLKCVSSLATSWLLGVFTCQVLICQVFKDQENNISYL